MDTILCWDSTCIPESTGCIVALLALFLLLLASPGGLFRINSPLALPLGNSFSRLASAFYWPPRLVFSHLKKKISSLGKRLVIYSSTGEAGRSNEQNADPSLPAAPRNRSIAAPLRASPSQYLHWNGHPEASINSGNKPSAMAQSTTRRWWLLFKAILLRMLMRIGMFFHSFPRPFPKSANFIRKIPSHSGRSRSLKLHFYTPKEYSQASLNGRRYPVVVNFHGGGFCLGSPSDDVRWAQVVNNTADAVFVSVGYRLAPEHPFPAAVDDGVDALLYLQEHANELQLDISRVTLSGFSAGGNLSFSVPMRLRSLYSSLICTDANNQSSFTVNDETTRPNFPRQDSSYSLLTPSTSTSPNELQIVSIVSWYPILDFLLARDIRRNRCVYPEKTISPVLTNLFDDSYIPNHADRSSPYASPIHAPDSMLSESLPSDIFIYMCEWDMLLHEGQQFVHQLERQGKKVRSMMIERQQHAWDKSPNPFRDQSQIDHFYQTAAEHVRKIFETANQRREVS